MTAAEVTQLIGESMLREQLAKEAKAVAEKEQAEFILRFTRERATLLELPTVKLGGSS